MEKNQSSTCKRLDRQHFVFKWAGRRYYFWWEDEVYKKHGSTYFDLCAKRSGEKWYRKVEGNSILHQACQMWADRPFYGGLNAAQFLKRTLRVRGVRWRK